MIVGSFYVVYWCGHRLAGGYLYDMVCRQFGATLGKTVRNVAAIPRRLKDVQRVVLLSLGGKRFRVNENPCGFCAGRVVV